MQTVTFSVFRGEPDQDGDPFGKMVDYTIDPVSYTHLTLPTTVIV